MESELIIRMRQLKWISFRRNILFLGSFVFFLLHFARLTPFLPIASFKSHSFLLQQMDEAFMEDDTIAE